MMCLPRFPAEGAWPGLLLFCLWLWFFGYMPTKIPVLEAKPYWIKKWELKGDLHMVCFFLLFVCLLVWELGEFALLFWSLLCGACVVFLLWTLRINSYILSCEGYSLIGKKEREAMIPARMMLLELFPNAPLFVLCNSYQRKPKCSHVPVSWLGTAPDIWKSFQTGLVSSLLLPDLAARR